MGTTAAIRPSESLLGITVSLMLVVVVLVPAVICSGGWLVFVSTSWAAAACPHVLGIVYVDSASKRGSFVVVFGSRPRRNFSLVLRSGCWWAGGFDVILSFYVLLSIFWCRFTELSPLLFLLIGHICDSAQSLPCCHIGVGIQYEQSQHNDCCLLYLILNLLPENISFQIMYTWKYYICFT